MKRWLKIKIGKTKVMSITRTANETNIKFDGEPLAVVQRFIYLGSVVNERTNLDCEIRGRINAASGLSGNCESEYSTTTTFL